MPDSTFYLTNEPVIDYHGSNDRVFVSHYNSSTQEYEVSQIPFNTMTLPSILGTINCEESTFIKDAYDIESVSFNGLFTAILTNPQDEKRILLHLEDRNENVSLFALPLVSVSQNGNIYNSEFMGITPRGTTKVYGLMSPDSADIPSGYFRFTETVGNTTLYGGVKITWGLEQLTTISFMTQWLMGADVVLSVADLSGGDLGDLFERIQNALTYKILFPNTVNLNIDVFVAIEEGSVSSHSNVGSAFLSNFHSTFAGDNSSRLDISGILDDGKELIFSLIKEPISKYSSLSGNAKLYEIYKDQTYCVFAAFTSVFVQGKFLEDDYLNDEIIPAAIIPVASDLTIPLAYYELFADVYYALKNLPTIFSGFIGFMTYPSEVKGVVRDDTGPNNETLLKLSFDYSIASLDFINEFCVTLPDDPTDSEAQITLELPSFLNSIEASNRITALVVYEKLPLRTVVQIGYNDGFYVSQVLNFNEFGLFKSLVTKKVSIMNSLELYVIGLGSDTMIKLPLVNVSRGDSVLYSSIAFGLQVLGSIIAVTIQYSSTQPESGCYQAFGDGYYVFDCNISL